MKNKKMKIKMKKIEEKESPIVSSTVMDGKKIITKSIVKKVVLVLEKQIDLKRNENI